VASEITPYFQIFSVSPKIHSMHTAKLPVDFPFQRKMSGFRFRRPSSPRLGQLILHAQATRLFSASWRHCAKSTAGLDLIICQMKSAIVIR
jgi:hypothetical protein